MTEKILNIDKKFFKYLDLQTLNSENNGELNIWQTLSPL